jgi:P-type Cu+ transporter
MNSNNHNHTIELPVKGMDCAGCARAVKQSIEKVEGVTKAEVLLSSEKAMVQAENGKEIRDAIVRAVRNAGYEVAEANTKSDSEKGQDALDQKARKILNLFGIVFGGVLFVVVAGEWLGLFESMTEFIPFWAGVILVLLMGYNVFKKVLVAAFQGRVIAHALMAVGALAALAAGEWVTAAIVVFFMRTGDYIEGFTTDKARDSLRSLTRFAPQKATVIRDGKETEIPVLEVKKGDIVLVRPGGKIPVDGVVSEGFAAVDQSAITGESMPREVSAGDNVYAATLAQGGRLTVKTTAAGENTTFGKIIRLVEEAEANRGEIQQYAEKFSAWYLPVVLLIAILTYVFRQDVMSTVAVLVVACSCAFALATPVALLATIGSGAKQGLLIKGGRYLEKLAVADVLLIDKTGTLTFGEPEISDMIPLNGISKGELLQLAASAEQYSEHPLARAIIQKAGEYNLTLRKPDRFKAVPGSGVTAGFDKMEISVTNKRGENTSSVNKQIRDLEKEGKTVMIVRRNSEPAGILAARDKERTEVRDAINQIRKSGIEHIELLTGDNETTAAQLAEKLSIPYRAELLPEDKIEIVKSYQQKGHKVVMIGDGVNDAPALAQADVGIAMGVKGTDVAIETAHITLMRDDWMLVPRLFEMSQRTMRVIKGNFGFTGLYNVAGLTLAAFGFLPPVLAAAAQSLPDIGIMFNSSRLLK